VRACRRSSRHDDRRLAGIGPRDNNRRPGHAMRNRQTAGNHEVDTLRAPRRKEKTIVSRQGNASGMFSQLVPSETRRLPPTSLKFLEADGLRVARLQNADHAAREQAEAGLRARCETMCPGSGRSKMVTKRERSGTYAVGERRVSGIRPSRNT